MSDKKVLAKSIEMGIGASMLASRMTLQATGGTELECTPFGVIATSGKAAKRKILIPWANIRACELQPDPKEPTEAPKKLTRNP